MNFTYGQNDLHGDNQNRTETGHNKSLSGRKKVTRLPKTHVDHWASKLRKRHFKSGGKVVEIPTWQVRMFHLRREEWFNTGTAVRAEAANIARNIFVSLQANGWELTLAKFKPKAETIPGDKLTVGQYLRSVEQAGVLSTSTRLNYQNCLRTIVAGCFGIKGGKEKFDYRTGGNEGWAKRIDEVKLRKITPERISKWKQSFIAKAGGSPAKRASRKRSLNSYIRCARSLFSKKLLKVVKGVDLPSPLPFDGVTLEDAGSSKYTSKINVTALIAAAKLELKATQPEAYKVFLLGLGAGMRKAEIDLLEWSMLNPHSNTIVLTETEWLRLKTNSSTGEIPIDEQVMTELRAYMADGKLQFVINSHRPPKNSSARPYYRCEDVFDHLTEWLRSKGITANKPLHELRKELGALIATEHGIFAASKFLRHGDVTTTARHYADHKKRITVGLGAMLDAEIRALQPAAVDSSS